MEKVSVIIPTLNEEKNLEGLLKELTGMGHFHILIVDGGSNDRTLKIAKKFGADIIIQNGRGKGVALRQAFNNPHLGDPIIIMDADGSMSPKEIPSLIKALDSSGADIAKGSRFLGNGRSEDITPIRRIGNQFFLLLVNLLWSTRYTDLCYGFAAFRKAAIEKLCKHLESMHFEIETEMFIKAKKCGLKVVEVPSIEFRRKHGKSNLNIIRDGFNILKTIIRELFNGYYIEKK